MNPEMSSGSRIQVEFTAAMAPLWSESGSRSYRSSEEQRRASEKPPEP